MEDGRTSDAITARDRCWNAVSKAKTVEEGQALWRAMARYHWKYRQDSADTGLESQRGTLPQLRAPGVEGVVARGDG